MPNILYFKSQVHFYVPLAETLHMLTNPFEGHHISSKPLAALLPVVPEALKHWPAISQGREGTLGHSGLRISGLGFSTGGVGGVRYRV